MGTPGIGDVQVGDDVASARTRKVLESHLTLRAEGDLERDLAENYADDVLLLSAEGVHRGHEGVRKLAGILQSYVSDGSRYDYDQLVVAADVGMLAWSAKGDTQGSDVEHGADSFVVHGGRIVVQTIHYVTAGSSGD